MEKTNHEWRCTSHIKNGDFPACHVSLLEGKLWPHPTPWEKSGSFGDSHVFFEWFFGFQRTYVFFLMSFEFLGYQRFPTKLAVSTFPFKEFCTNFWQTKSWKGSFVHFQPIKKLKKLNWFPTWDFAKKKTQLHGVSFYPSKGHPRCQKSAKRYHDYGGDLSKQRSWEFPNKETWIDFWGLEKPLPIRVFWPFSYFSAKYPKNPSKLDILRTKTPLL